MNNSKLDIALTALGEIKWSNDSSWQSERAAVAIKTLREAQLKKIAPLADAIWKNDDIMSFNAELGLTIDQLTKLALLLEKEINR